MHCSWQEQSYSWIGPLRPEGVALVLGDVVVRFLIRDLFRKPQGKLQTGPLKKSKKNGRAEPVRISKTTFSGGFRSGNKHP